MTLSLVYFDPATHCLEKVDAKTERLKFECNDKLIFIISQPVLLTLWQHSYLCCCDSNMTDDVIKNILKQKYTDGIFQFESE